LPEDAEPPGHHRVVLEVPASRGRWNGGSPYRASALRHPDDRQVARLVVGSCSARVFPVPRGVCCHAVENIGVRPLFPSAHATPPPMKVGKIVS